MVPSALVVTGEQARIHARNNEHQGPTSGLAPGFLQANMIILPSKYATDFRNLCARNPVPCPLVAESTRPGCFNAVKSAIPNLKGTQLLGEGVDLRRDAPRYMVYKDSRLEKSYCSDITAEWTEDHVAFLIGCSFSFETELQSAGLAPRHIVLGRNVPMYRTSVPLSPAGVFTGSTFVVSMRPYKRSELDDVRRITRKYSATHGEPIAWGWEAVDRLGIEDINAPEWGDAPLSMGGQRLMRKIPQGCNTTNDEEDIPVFWGCGVTPQEAVMKAGLEGVIMAHAPGHMLLLDARDGDIIQCA